MVTAAQFIAAVAADLGYVESPPGSNRNKFAAVAGHANGQPWCATMLVAKAKTLGLNVPDSAYTPAMAQGFKARGAWHTTPKVGDFSFWDFPDDVHRIQHVEVVESIASASVTDIGGNTSSDEHGSQSNGGGVFRRRRSTAYCVGYGRPPYALPEEDDVLGGLDHKVLDKKGDKTLWFVFTDPVTGLATGGCYRIPSQAQADQQIALERQRLEAAGRPHALSDVRQTWPGSRLDKITEHSLGDLP